MAQYWPLSQYFIKMLAFILAEESEAHRGEFIGSRSSAYG